MKAKTVSVPKEYPQKGHLEVCFWQHPGLTRRTTASDRGMGWLLLITGFRKLLEMGLAEMLGFQYDHFYLKWASFNVKTVSNNKVGIRAHLEFIFVWRTTERKQSIR